jgi:four helix bundle protein
MDRKSFHVDEEEKKDIVKRSYKFALRTLYIAGKLPRNAATFRLIDQLVGAGTSIGSNAEEASAGFSKNDFTFKMSVASKESREANYWLRLLRDSGIIKDKGFLGEILEAVDESDQLKRMLTSIVKTSQGK